MTNDPLSVSDDEEEFNALGNAGKYLPYDLTEGKWRNVQNRLASATLFSILCCALSTNGSHRSVISRLAVKLANLTSDCQLISSVCSTKEAVSRKY